MGKAERTKQFIIEKSAPIFNKKGYAGTSISDLTEATKLTKGSIYGNFRDKDEVAVEVFKYNLDRLLSPLKSAVDQAKSWKDRLLAYPRAYREIYRQVLIHGACPILNTAVEADDTHPVLKRLAAQAVNQWLQSLVQHLDEGKLAGEVKAEINSQQFASAMLALIEGGNMLTRVTGEEAHLLHCLEQVERMIQTLGK